MLICACPGPGRGLCPACPWAPRALAWAHPPPLAAVTAGCAPSHLLTGSASTQALIRQLSPAAQLEALALLVDMVIAVTIYASANHVGHEQSLIHC